MCMENGEKLSPTFECSCGNKMTITVTPVENDNHITLGGYFSGNDSCKCTACGASFTGDKHSTQCISCGSALCVDIIEALMNAADDRFNLLLKNGCVDDDDKEFMTKWDKIQTSELGESSYRELLKFMT